MSPTCFPRFFWDDVEDTSQATKELRKKKLSVLAKTLLERQSVDRKGHKTSPLSPMDSILFPTPAPVLRFSGGSIMVAVMGMKILSNLLRAGGAANSLRKQAQRTVTLTFTLLPEAKPWTLIPWTLTT